MAQLIEDVVLDASAGVHRPRNLDWKRAAALLYGDWGTSKAYVIGLAFVAAGFSSLPIILAVCALTGLVGINYIVIPSFPRWRRCLLCRARAEPVAGGGRGATAGCRSYGHGCAQWLVCVELHHFRCGADDLDPICSRSHSDHNDRPAF